MTFDELCERTYNFLLRTIILKKFAYIFQGHEKQRVIVLIAAVTAVVVIGAVVCRLAAVNVV